MTALKMYNHQTRRRFADGGDTNPFEEIGSAIEQGFGGLLSGDDEPATSGHDFFDVFAGQQQPQRGEQPQQVQQSLFGDGKPLVDPAISNALITAGLAMMASPRSNPFEAFGQGALQGLTAYQESMAANQQTAKEAAEKAANEEFVRKLYGPQSGGARSTPAGAPATSTAEAAPATAGNMSKTSGEKNSPKATAAPRIPQGVTQEDIRAELRRRGAL